MGRISEWATPPGGWQFQEGPVLIRGDTRAEVIKFVKSHRISNKMEIGDVGKELDDRIAEAYPELIIDGSRVTK